MSEASLTLTSSRLVLPALIDRAGKPDARRFLEFFTVNIRNPNTRATYGRAAGAFLHWCESRGLQNLYSAVRSRPAPPRLSKKTKRLAGSFRLPYSALVITKDHAFEYPFPDENRTEFAGHTPGSIAFSCQRKRD